MNHEDQPNIERIAGDAHSQGHIDTQKLCFILAEDSEYDVDGLMRGMGVDTRFFPKQRGQTPYRERVGKWYYIIQKMISWDFADMQGKRIPLYGSSNEGWRLIGVDEGSRKNIQYAFFKLTDLEKWFTEILKIPFPGCLTPRDTEAQGQDTIDPNRWQFRFTGSVWEIDFKGCRYSIDDVKPVRYMIPLIKQPGVLFGCVELGQLVDGGAISDDHTMTESIKGTKIVEGESDFVGDGLNLQDPYDFPGGHTSVEIREAIAFARKCYREQRLDDEELERTKIYFLEEYGLLMERRGMDLEFRKSKYQSAMFKEYKDARDIVSQYKGRFLRHLKKKNHTELYEHFKQNLELKAGKIQYTVPKGAPQWDWKVTE